MKQRGEVTKARHRARPAALRRLVAVALVAAGTVAGATAAAAAAAIIVTPTTGLVDGQTVTVEGAGWSPNEQLGMCEGVLIDPPDATNCGSGTVQFIAADNDGNFSSSLIVKRLIAVPRVRGTVDCADPAAPCVIGVADIGNIPGTLVSATLHFAPALPFVLPGTGSVLEGDSATTNLSVPVTLSYASAQTVTVQWETLFVSGDPPCQADPATDYTPASGTVTFVPSDTAEAVSIAVKGDTEVEPNECILVRFHDAVNAVVGGFNGLGQGTITNDDLPLRVVPGAASIAEGDSGVTDLHVPVTLSKPFGGTVTVQWTTFVHAGAPSCQASPASDYTAASGTVTFVPSDTAETVTIAVNGDTEVEPNECILVRFHDPTNAALGGYFGLGVGTITDDD
jgi:hypothetical protein